MSKNSPCSRCVLSFVAVALIVALAAVGFIYYQARQKMEQSIRADYDILVKTQTQTAVSILKKLYEKSQMGEITLSQAKTLGQDILRDLRYYDDASGYFWADTSNGANVVLHGDAIEGKNRWDSNVGGVYHVREIVANGKKPGGGFTDYYFYRLNDNKPLSKRGYSLWFEPFDWIVGTGYYIEDINALVSEKMGF